MQSGRSRGQTNEYRQPETDRYGRPDVYGHPLLGNAARQSPHAIRRDRPKGAVPPRDAGYQRAPQSGQRQTMRAGQQQPDRRSLAVSYSSVRQNGSGQRMNVAPMNIQRVQPVSRGQNASGGAYQGRPRIQTRGTYPPQKRPIGGNRKVNQMVKGKAKKKNRTTIRDFVLGLAIGFAIFGPAAYFVCKTIIGIFA